MILIALFFLWQTGPLYPHMVVATIIGVFLAVILGSGLFAVAYFSNKSGHDDEVRNATTKQRDQENGSSSR